MTNPKLLRLIALIRLIKLTIQLIKLDELVKSSFPSPVEDPVIAGAGA
jgi:hypothetical protein